MQCQVFPPLPVIIMEELVGISLALVILPYILVFPQIWFKGTRVVVVGGRWVVGQYYGCNRIPAGAQPLVTSRSRM